MKLIDKDALVAEIERRIKAIPRGETDKRLKAIYGNEAFIYNDLLSFIDSMPKRQVYILKGEIKDAPIADTGDYEIFLDYCRDEYENIIDKICDYVNEKYPNDIDRYKVTVQITIDKED